MPHANRASESESECLRQARAPADAPATAPSQASFLVIDCSRDSGDQLLVCSTPGCCRPRRYWRIHRETFSGAALRAFGRATKLERSVNHAPEGRRSSMFCMRNSDNRVKRKNDNARKMKKQEAEGASGSRTKPAADCSGPLKEKEEEKAGVAG